MTCVFVFLYCLFFFFFKQKTAYEMRISDWSSDVCSSDLRRPPRAPRHHVSRRRHERLSRQRARLLPSPVRRWRRLPADLPALGTEPDRYGGAGRSGDRKSVVEGKSVSVRVDLGGRRILKKNKQQLTQQD